MSKYYLTNRNGDYLTDRDENYFTIRKLRGSYENLNIVEIDSLSVYDLNSNNLIAYLDELQSATISHTEDKEDITGKNGRKISSLKRNKRVTISGTNGLLSAGILQAQIGSKFEQLNSAQIKYEEILIAKNGAVKLTYRPVGAIGSEIIGVLVRDINGNTSASYKQSSKAENKEFTYTPLTKTITFDKSVVTDGSEVIVFYMRKVNGAAVLENTTEHYSVKARIYTDFIAEDKCGNIFRGQFYFPLAEFSGEFDIELGDAQAVHNFEAEVLSGACGKGGMLWQFTVFTDSDWN